MIVALNNSDVADVVTRGGMERFLGDGTIRGDRAPWWDWLYGISFITRHVVHDVLNRSWLLLTPDEHTAAQAVARPELRKALDAIRAVAHDLGAPVVVVLSPHQYEVQDGQYEPGFRPLAEELVASGDTLVIDVLSRFLTTGAVTKDNTGEFYWTLDYHHSARGYAAMGDAIVAGMRARHVLPDR